MAKAKTVQIHKVKMRQGEGVRLVVTDRKKEADGETITIDMQEAPVPERRYVADAAAVVNGAAGFRVIFGQTKLSASGAAALELRSMIDIQMSRRAVGQFLSTLVNLDPGWDGIETIPLLQNINEPAQTAGLSANLAPVGISGHECCVDFYQMSPFSSGNLKSGGDIYAEPVVRVMLPTGLFVSVARQLATMLGPNQST
jgi:predicted RNA-binding protein